MYPELVFLNEDQFPLILIGDKRQVTLKNAPVKPGDLLNTCFGLAEVTDLIKYQGNCTIRNLRQETQETWAYNEGFSDFEQADLWFRMQYGEKWAESEMITVKFKGDWVNE